MVRASTSCRSCRLLILFGGGAPSCPANTKRAAQQYERELREAILSGARKEHRPTLRSFFQDYLEAKASGKNKRSVLATKRWLFAKHIDPALGGRTVDSIETTDVDKLAAAVQAAGCGRKTSNNVLSTLKVILRYAARVKLIKAVPDFELHKIELPDVESLTAEQYSKLLAAQNHETHLALLLAGDAGLRRGEVAGLQWADIDFKAGQLEVRRSLWEGEADLPKGNRTRKVPLTVRRERRAAGSPRHLQGAWVLVRPVKRQGVVKFQPWSAEVFRYRGRAAYKAAGLAVPRRPWHCLRFCSLLADAGVPVTTIRELAGHTDLKITLRYCHAVDATLRAGIEALTRATMAQPSTAGKGDGCGRGN